MAIESSALPERELLRVHGDPDVGDQRLVELAESDARGRARDFAGPREERLIDLVRSYASEERLRAPIISIPLPGEMGAAMRSGAPLPAPDAQLGTLTFTEWMRSR
jgi:hypothetical protein